LPASDTQFYQPSTDLQDLFIAVQTSGIFADSKTFVDCRPKSNPDSIVAAYLGQRSTPGFNLKAFVLENFYLPEIVDIDFESDLSLSLEDHLQNHWPNLTRPADEHIANSSLIPLPKPYVVPGGRFREIYYWDSYFTMQGLVASGRMDLVKDMLDNFAWLINQVGHIPNGNRTYYLSRSQPPYFGSMVKLYQKQAGTEAALPYLPALETEYDFWMNDSELLNDRNKLSRRVVKLEDGSVLNRYYDDLDTPRPESYSEDVAIARELPAKQHSQIYRNLRAAAESGWDFSSRWMSEPPRLATTHTTDIIPIDLNCLLHQTETLLSELYLAQQNSIKAEHYDQLANKREAAIHQYLWDDAVGWFRDYDWVQKNFTPAITMAAVSALYCEVATQPQADKIASLLEDKFLKEGGFVTTLLESEQQWDAPNGWAPLQWLAINGLRCYDHNRLADTAGSRWLRLNRKVYLSSGRMMEKYNVIDTTLAAGGGEYPLQDGFGWTNGVALGLIFSEE
jgi:alpha,alpha-trehalase